MTLKKLALNSLINAGLLTVGAFLFSLAFPSFLSDWGWGPLAFIAIIPVFIMVHRNSLVENFIWGFLYGYITYKIFNFWLAEFNPTAHIVVPFIYAAYGFILFPLMGWVSKKTPNKAWLTYTLLWVAYEVLRTKGFLGYAYGIIGYTQYRFLSFIAIADITGPLGVSALVVLPQALIAWRLNYPPKKEERKKKWLIPMGIYAGIFLLVNLYGLAAKVDYSESKIWRPALIQHNEDAWLSGMETYKLAYEVLARLSSEALEQNPDTIIWPETAFVPAIEWHEKYRREAAKLDLVRRLRSFLKEADTDFIIGNNDSRMVRGEKRHWNAILLFQNGEITNRYHKIHLVPFGEHFPYERLFPRLHKRIVDLGATFYQKGNEYTIMETAGVSFGSLVCFEDTFPYLARNFTRAGAEVMVNVTNDAWSQANASCMQHGAMAVFRAVENRRSMVRSTCSGFTTAIDPNGKLLGHLKPFTEDYMIAEVPLYTDRTTLYTRFGDWFDWSVIAGSIFLIASILFKDYFKKKEQN